MVYSSRSPCARNVADKRRRGQLSWLWTKPKQFGLTAARNGLADDRHEMALLVLPLAEYPPSMPTTPGTSCPDLWVCNSRSQRLATRNVFLRTDVAFSLASIGMKSCGAFTVRP
jgi:hypothetical protein